MIIWIFTFTYFERKENFCQLPVIDQEILIF